jgi:DNA-binding transcriptional MocR family regulator
VSKEISVIDEILLRAAAGGKSGDEIEKITGIPAAQALQKIKQLLSSRDVWTEMEQRQLLLAEMHELKDSLRAAAIEGQDPEAARVLLRTLEVIGKRLDTQQTVLDSNMIKLSMFQQKILMRAMDSALTFAKGELAERYPQIGNVELDELVANGLQRAKLELMEDDNG